VRFSQAGFDESDWLEICEMFYDDDEPVAHTASGISVCGESVEELRATLQRMLDCLDKPILDEMKKGEVND
jgi:hypothetical protein